MGSFSLLPEDVRREGERLLDVSMWCLGRDVAHEGNLLLRRGLTRERIPAGQPGTSAYSGELSGGGALTLWGFGALCRVCGEAVYVPRDGFVPVLVDAEGVRWPVFQAAGLGAPRAPSTARERQATRAAVVALAGWMAGYEEWVVAQAGPGWRHECVTARRKASPVPVEALSSAWRRLAERVAALDATADDSLASAAGA
jgi:hypothetical protein